MVTRSRMGPGGRQLVWVLAGATLDAAALIGIWLLLDAIGPLPYMAEYWLDALGLVMVPWLVHVVALRSFLRITWIKAAHLLARSAAFLALSAILIPVMGFAMFFLVGLPFFAALTLIRSGNWSLVVTSANWIDIAADRGFWITSATTVGAAVGLLLHALRPGGTTKHPPSSLLHHPRTGSDVLGGMAAAFLAFGGMYAALPFGLFIWAADIPNDWTHQLATVPSLPATIVIGVTASLPHLLMVGRDLFSTDPRLNGRSDRNNLRR